MSTNILTFWNISKNILSLIILIIFCRCNISILTLLIIRNIILRAFREVIWIIIIILRWYMIARLLSLIRIRLRLLLRYLLILSALVWWWWGRGRQIWSIIIILINWRFWLIIIVFFFLIVKYRLMDISVWALLQMRCGWCFCCRWYIDWLIWWRWWWG